MKSTFIILLLSLSANFFAQNSNRIYNGVVLSIEDLNYIISSTSEFITKNCTYSDDIRRVSDLANKVKQEISNGHMPKFDPTSTGLTIGSLYISPGKHNQNYLGKFEGENLYREFAFRLKEGFESYTKSSEISQTTSNTTPTEKYHKSLGTSIADRYFGGVWENVKKGIKYWDAETRRIRTRQAIIDLIVYYKEIYGVDSPYVSKLSQLSNPKISTNEIIEIAFSMGMDATWIFEL